MKNENTKRIPTVHKCIATLWPSFLVAIVATGLFFSAFEPRHLIPFNVYTDIPDIGMYTLGFFFFWAITLASGIGTLYFTITNCMSCAKTDESE